MLSILKAIELFIVARLCQVPVYQLEVKVAVDYVNLMLPATIKRIQAAGGYG